MKQMEPTQSNNQGSNIQIDENITKGNKAVESPPNPFKMLEGIVDNFVEATPPPEDEKPTMPDPRQANKAVAKTEPEKAIGDSEVKFGKDKKEDPLGASLDDFLNDDNKGDKNAPVTKEELEEDRWEDIPDAEEGQSAASNFQKLKEKFKKEKSGYLDQIKELEKKYKNVHGAVEKQLIKEVEDLKLEKARLAKENMNLTHYRKKFAFRKDPSVQKEFIQPIEEKRNEALSILNSYEGDRGVLQQLLDAPGRREINDILAATVEDADDRSDLKRLVGDINKLETNLEKIESSENIDLALDTITKERRKAMTGHLSNGFKAALESLSDRQLEEFTFSLDNKEHNEKLYNPIVQDAEKSLKLLASNEIPENFNESRASKLAIISLMSAAYPKVMQQKNSLVKENESLQRKIAELEESLNPSINQRGPTKRTEAPKKYDDLDDLVGSLIG